MHRNSLYEASSIIDNDPILIQKGCVRDARSLLHKMEDYIDVVNTAKGFQRNKRLFKGKIILSDNILQQDDAGGGLPCALHRLSADKPKH